MPKTRVVNLHRDPYDVYVGRRGKGRPGAWGNPHDFGRPCRSCGGKMHTGNEALDLFREYFLARVESDPEFRAATMQLKGRVLG